MFVAVAKVTLTIPDSGSLKSKRHVLHKVLDKVKARFNVAIAEVADNDLWQRATLGIAAVANDHSFAQECISKTVRFIEELYVAPVVACTTEVIPIGGELFGDDDGSTFGSSARGTSRTLADAEREAAGGAGPAPAPVRFSEAYTAARAGGRPAARRGGRTMTPSEREQAIEDLRRRLREARRSDGEGEDD